MRAKEVQVPAAGNEGVFAGLQRAALLALGPLAAFAIPEITT